MSFEDEQCNVRQVVIDVLADQGQTWIKVVARNPQSLYLASLGAAGYGKRSLIHQMKDLVTCAKLNPFMYKQPIIKVWFAAGVATKLKNSLKKINVESIGNCVEVEEMFLEDLSSTDESEDENYDDVNVPLDNKSNIPVETCDMHDSSMDSFNSTFWKNKNLLSLSQIPHGSILNLDVSTMIAYVSSLTNGNCHYEFKDAILTEQAARERICPVKPILDELFKGKQLVCCKMAYTDFQEIISTIGGPMECERARNLFKLVKVVNDQISDAATNLSISSRVKTRSRVIFGTGDSLKAITVTANQGFLRACEGQGVNFVSFLHYSRALTELKEASATEI